jgi:plasmid stabilization system protein ParE
MKKYAVRISKSAQNDIYQIIDHISHVYKAPLTAEKYLIGLYDAIFSLENFAESIPVSTKTDISKYGLNARSITFKKLIIVYTVRARIILVQAVIPGALVKN